MTTTPRAQHTADRPASPAPPGGTTDRAADGADAVRRRSVWSQPDTWAAISVVAICVGIAIPVGLAQLRGTDVFSAPPWVWWTSYAAFLLLIVAVTAVGETTDRSRLPWLLALHTGVTSVAVLSTIQAGWTPILLVFVAALAAHYVSLRVTMTIVAWNCAVIAVSALWVGASMFEVAFSAGVYLFLQVCSVMAVLLERRERTAKQELAVAHTELRATSALLAESSRTNERLRIARELHDVVGHQLTALALELEVATHHAQPPAREHVTRARGLAKDLLSDVRGAVGNLRAATPELRGALRAITDDLPDLAVHLDVADDLRVDEDTITALVRCVQEVVTNTIRHAGARNLWIELRERDGRAVLSTRDDGSGAPDLQVGNGLIGMRERIEQLGGTIAFSSDGGFRVVAQVPAS